MILPNRTPNWVPGFLRPEDISGPARVLAFHEKDVLLKGSGNRLEIPLDSDLKGIGAEELDVQYSGTYFGLPCRCLFTAMRDAPAGYAFIPYRDIFRLTGDEELFTLIGTAYQLVNWSRCNHFCGRCGAPMEEKTDERAKHCRNCGSLFYPRISPATITAVFRGGEILLAHNRSFPEDLYSLVAGFIEPGETAEQCAAREVFEETGLRIKNIRYFTSQPWPFPDSLMLAFTADYADGEIQTDNTEITRAGWFGKGNLPRIPTPESVAGKMIRRFLSEKSLER